MGCGDACPVFPGRCYEDWVLDDPAGLEINAVRPIRDEIGRRVNELLDQISAGTSEHISVRQRGVTAVRQTTPTT